MKAEKKIAEAILQNAQQINIGGKTFDVTPATPATLIMVSEAVAELPIMGRENILECVLAKAKDAKALGKIVAILILGAKRIKENRKIRISFWKKKSEVEWLAEYILDNTTTAELAEVVSQRLSKMQIGDFFGLTTSLSVANIIKPTKEVETQYGE